MSHHVRPFVDRLVGWSQSVWFLNRSREVKLPSSFRRICYYIINHKMRTKSCWPLESVSVDTRCSRKIVPFPINSHSKHNSSWTPCIYQLFSSTLNDNCFFFSKIPLRKRKHWGKISQKNVQKFLQCKNCGENLIQTWLQESIYPHKPPNIQ